MQLDLQPITELPQIVDMHFGHRNGTLRTSNASCARILRPCDRRKIGISVRQLSDRIYNLKGRCAPLDQLFRGFFE